MKDSVVILTFMWMHLWSKLSYHASKDYFGDLEPNNHNGLKRKVT